MIMGCSDIDNVVQGCRFLSIFFPFAAKIGTALAMLATWLCIVC